MFKLEGRAVGRYRLGERIGQGGTGVVLAATEEPGGRQVAVKLLFGAHTEDPEFLARFRREAEVVGKLDHPNIVRLLEAGEEPDVGPYLVMERAQGRNLRRLLQDHAPLEPRRAARIAAQVAAALEHAHANRVVHRDIKPENLLVTDDDRVVVTDFGIARVAEGTRHTRTGLMPGTPEYMAPEQLSGTGTVTAKADLYSLGIVLYEMLAGRTPFHSENVAEVIHRQAYQQPVTPGFQPRQLDALVLRCLEKDPEARPLSAAALRQQLQALAEQPPPGQPTIQVPLQPPPPPRTRLALLPVLLVLAALLLAGATLQRALQPPPWLKEAVGAEPAPLARVLAGAVTVHGAEVALFGPTRNATALEKATAASNRLAERLRIDRLGDARCRKDGDDFVLESPGGGELIRVTPATAALVGARPQDAGEWWLALLRDHLALKRGEQPDHVLDYERDHPFRKDRPVGPIFDRVYQRARHQVREGTLPTEAILTAIDSLDAKDRDAFLEAAREVPR